MPIDNLQALSDEMGAVVARVSKSVIRVDARHRIAGSGSIWSSDGVIVTADHVVEREENIHVQFEGSSFDAELVGRDPTTDLAVLRIKTDMKLVPTEVADPKTIRAGNLVFAIGRPWGEEPIVSAGIVSAFGRFSFGPGWGDQFREGLIHADVVLYPGFSGGPLADASGRVIGINSSVIGRGMSLAIPTETATRVVTALLKEGHVQRAHLGVGLQKIPLADTLKQKLQLSQETGLMVLTTEAGSAADKAGILAGDILIGMNGTPIGRLRELQRWLAGANVGQQTRARVIRGGEIQELPISLGAS